MSYEGKAAKVNSSNIPNIQAEVLSERHFKVILQSPALFTNGNEPNLKWFADLGVDVRILTKIVGKPIKIGGWNLIDEKGNQCPKPMLSATQLGVSITTKLLTIKLFSNY